MWTDYLIIMPVKDSMETTEQAIRAITKSGNTLIVYDDFSSAASSAQLDRLQAELKITVVHLRDRTNHPSPNYRWVLIDAQQRCLATHRNLIIVESDVFVQGDTFSKMVGALTPETGMIAAVTTDANGIINFPYEYAKSLREDSICGKRLSFCCTMLTEALLCAYDFAQLAPEKNWYDVMISHQSRKMGLSNMLMISNPVVHLPHSSRPWKRLKYTNPLAYYWHKWILGRDKI